MSHSYRKTLFSFITTALLPLILLGSLIAWIIYDNVTEELRRRNFYTLSQIAASNDLLLGELNSTYLTVTNNDELNFLLSDILSSGKANYYDIQLYNALKTFLYSQTSSRNYIHSVYIKIDEFPQRFFSSLDGVVNTDTFHDTDWMSDLSFPPGENLAILSRSINASISTPATDVISICRRFFPVSSKKTGTIVLNLDKNYLNNMLHISGNSSSSEILAECGGDILAMSSPQMASKWSPHLEDLKKNDESFFEYNLNREKYIVSRSGTNQYGICFYMFTKASDLYAVPYTIISVIIICALLFILASSLIFFILSEKQYARIQHIIQILQKESDKQNVLLPQKNYDEFEYIARQIQDNYLLQKYFETELSEKAYKLKYSELAALQAQINPHMLYNTLENIRWKSYRLTDGYNEVVMMLESLSALLKYSLNPATSMVSIGEEIDNTVNYIRLVTLRYPEQFQIIWDYSEEVMNYATMRLMLQPVIENAIHHGARQKMDGKTCIRIRIAHIDDMIQVQILNTGTGMSAEQLAKVRQTLTLDFAPAKGMGLYNINKRLQLQYGTKLTIHSSPAHGAVVIFSFPAEFYETTLSEDTPASF